MLYEVITVFGTTCTDLRKVNTKMLDIFDGSDMLEQKMLENKLLSDFESELRTVQIANSMGRVKDLLFTDIRITSYNVCYTKLLRRVRSATVPPLR